MSTQFRSAKIIFTLLATLSAKPALAWGERGHFTVGYSAARMFESEPTTDEKAKLGTYFTSRAIAFGHVSNMPDISWRDSRRPTVVALNSPTHHFDVEFLIGAPSEKVDDTYLDKIRNLEPNLAEFLKKYQGQPNPIREGKTTNVATDSGSAPFRTQQLYNLMVEAFKCAKSKQPTTPYDYKVERPKFHEPIQKGRYACSDKTSYGEDLEAATEVGGVMGHFVEDLSQPFHVSADYDGYLKGQGDIHAYFETEVVQNLDEDLTRDVLKSARTNKLAILKRLKIDNFDEMPVAAIIFHLAADTYSRREALYDLDKKFAVTKLGTVVAINQSWPKDHIAAERRPSNDPKVQKAMRPLIVERLAISTVLLYKLWHRAWHEAGEPDVHEFNYIASPYPLDVPFVAPDEAIVKDPKLEKEL